MTAQIIYFDPEDVERDGKGWNIVSNDDGAVALRFKTLDEARDWCHKNGEFYTIVRSNSWQ